MKLRFIGRCVTLLFCLLLIHGTLYANTVNMDKLEFVRENIVFPELTLDEKKRVAQQAQIFMRDLYVHRYQKVDYYDDHTDPVTAIEEIVNNIETLSSAQMEEGIYKIFAAQRDLHLNYYLPAPYGNYTSFLPFTFIRVAGKDNYFEVRINSVNEELFKKFAPTQKIPQVGDIVLSYNELGIKQAVKKQLPFAQGANQFGGFSRALGLLTYVSHRRHLLPDTNEVTLRLQSYQDVSNNDEISLNEYTITFPWITKWKDPSAMRDSLEREIKRFNMKELDLGVDFWQREFNQFLQEQSLQPESVYPNNPTNEPDLKWGIIENVHGKFGYLRLKTFAPKNGVDFTIKEIRSIIVNSFTDTDGLIFDVRNNGGGYISFADKLSQLFSRREADVLEFRLFNNDLNRRMFNETSLGQTQKPEWTKVVNDAKGTGNKFTDLAAFTYDSEANVLGQVYYKPVAVLTNARCYSSTDMFSCAMQDNRAALIYGEDPQTGAGGANVITHNFFRGLLPEVFEKLPGNHAMRVSWRQTIRFGKNEGELIEDYGCSADKDVSLSALDVVTGGETQLKKITRSLQKRGKKKKYRAYATATEKSQELYFLNDRVKYGISTFGTRQVNVLLNNELLKKISNPSSENETPVEVELPDTLPSGTINNLSFFGLKKKKRVLWNLKRQIILLDEKIIPDTNGFEIDFNQAETIAPLTCINQNPPEDGWNLVKPYLQIGYDLNYKDNLDSDTVLFLNLTQKEMAALSFGMEFETEKGWDFIEVYVTNNSERVTLFRGSGKQTLQTQTYDLSAFAGQDNVGLHFRFTSDSNTNDRGVKISNISVK